MVMEDGEIQMFHSNNKLLAFGKSGKGAVQSRHAFPSGLLICEERKEGHN
jgi:hypothetical protein